MFFVFNRSDGITAPILYFPPYSRPNTAKFDIELYKTPSTTHIGQQIPILRTSSLNFSQLVETHHDHYLDKRSKWSTCKALVIYNHFTRVCQALVRAQRAVALTLYAFFFLIFSNSKQPSTVVWSQISEALCGDHVLPEFSHKLPGNADFRAQF